MNLTLLIIIVGEACLLLTLTNRVLGSYVRTPIMAVERTLIVALAGIFLVLPAILDCLSAGVPEQEGTIITLALSIAAIIYFFWPALYGVKQAPLPGTVEEKHSLTEVIDLSVVKVELSKHIEDVKISPLKILVLSDLHCNSRKHLQKISDALSKVAENDYDSVFVLGDLGERPVLIPEVLKLLGSLQSRYGVFMVRGNHDFEGGRADLIVAEAEYNSINILANSSTELSDSGISLIGLEYPPRIDTAMNAPKNGKNLTIALSHTPDNFFKLADAGVDLVLSGHTHGGKLRLPLVGPLLVPSKYGRFFDKGWFRYKKTVMYITPGLGYCPGSLMGKGTFLELQIS